MSSLDDGNHSSSHSHSIVRKRISGMSFHDDVIDELTEPLSEMNMTSSHHSPIPSTSTTTPPCQVPREGHSNGSNNDDDDDDEDDDNSFGEASDSCEPDAEYMEQILEECHPERLNLLEKEVPESVYKKKPKIIVTRTVVSTKPRDDTDSDDDDDDNASQPQQQQQKDVGTKQLHSPRSPFKRSSKASMLLSSTHSDNDSDTANIKSDDDDDDDDDDDETDIDNEVKTEDSESLNDAEEVLEEEAGEDAFKSSPEQRPQSKISAMQRAKMMESIGGNTKKSLRTINSSFWSKPFKGLAHSVRRTGSQKGLAE